MYYIEARPGCDVRIILFLTLQFCNLKIRFFRKITYNLAVSVTTLLGLIKIVGQG